MTADSELMSILGEADLFRGLSPKELGAIVRAATQVDHPAGGEVTAEGLGGVGFHLILDGEAEVSQRGNRIRTLGRGDYFGEISLIDGQPRSATVTALTPMRTLALTSWSFKPLLSQYPGIPMQLLLHLCERLREAEGRTQA